jgi:acid stress-induced BolA-like protein IbaG/YrbA
MSRIHGEFMEAQELKKLIADGLECESVEVESADGIHWSATIVSSAFEGKSPVARHRMVYAALGDKIDKNEVHALSMKCVAPSKGEPNHG